MEKRLRVVGDRMCGIGYRVFLGDKDISEIVTSLTISMSAGEVNTATIKLVAGIDVDGVFEVTKE